MAEARRNSPTAKRFKVLRRDNFTCQYCGAKAPAVVLQVDHVVPVSQGGDGEMDNLVTSCVTCNRGKGTLRVKSPLKRKAKKPPEPEPQPEPEEEKVTAWRI